MGGAALGVAVGVSVVGLAVGVSALGVAVGVTSEVSWVGGASTSVFWDTVGVTSSLCSSSIFS